MYFTHVLDALCSLTAYQGGSALFLEVVTSSRFAIVCVSAVCHTAQVAIRSVTPQCVFHQFVFCDTTSDKGFGLSGSIMSSHVTSTSWTQSSSKLLCVFDTSYEARTLQQCKFGNVKRTRTSWQHERHAARGRFVLEPQHRVHIKRGVTAVPLLSCCQT